MLLLSDKLHYEKFFSKKKNSSVCQMEAYQTPNGVVIVLTELKENKGTSVTNRVERAAYLAWEKLNFPTPCRFITNYPESDSPYTEVIFPTYIGKTDLVVLDEQFGCPEWNHITDAEFQKILNPTESKAGIRKSAQMPPRHITIDTLQPGPIPNDDKDERFFIVWERMGRPWPCLFFEKYKTGMYCQWEFDQDMNGPALFDIRNEKNEVTGKKFSKPVMIGTIDENTYKLLF